MQLQKDSKITDASLFSALYTENTVSNRKKQYESSNEEATVFLASSQPKIMVDRNQIQNTPQKTLKEFTDSKLTQIKKQIEMSKRLSNFASGNSRSSTLRQSRSREHETFKTKPRSNTGVKRSMNHFQEIKKNSIIMNTHKSFFAQKAKIGLNSVLRRN